MPAHQIDLQDPKSLGRLLLAITIASKNELRLKACDYDSIDAGRLLVVDFDREAGDIVIRATSSYGRAMAVTPENFQWTLPLTAAPLERARTEATQRAARTHVPTDEELADLETKSRQDQSLAKLEEEGKAPLKIRTQR